jgi:hypothetical protein
MKCTRKKDTFNPVTITIESQEELNQLFAVVNNCLITDVCPSLHVIWEELTNDIPESEYQKYHDDINASFLKFFKNRGDLE